MQYSKENVCYEKLYYDLLREYKKEFEIVKKEKIHN
jgi:hypothetical protein